MEESIFVARERELAELHGLLNNALAGQGQVCFVAGQAGSGKSALIAEFARQAQGRHSDLVAAVGQGDSFTGVGDPYLLFREILALLTGDVEAKVAKGAITQGAANRLREILAFSGEALAEVGPDLIGIFVPGGGVVARAAAFGIEKAGWFEKLEGLDRRWQEREETGKASSRQENVFEQYTKVLQRLAAKRPLLLLLDDLQWADASSIDLLFRLGRRIGESRILIVGTYRPEEIALGRGGEQHPLEKVLAEFKRYFGDICVDLDEAGRLESERFVAAFLDTEPNRLEESFRQALLRRTQGHPLFTIELLRDMQERGDLLKDADGNWIESPDLDWDSLPAMVEGAIEGRLSRLTDELRRTLSVGSVEGETFTAEVVAKVQDTETRQLIQCLSEQLEKEHRLVSSRGISMLGEQILSLYQFQHSLFQTFLYNALGEADRLHIHKAVGSVLEELYGGRVDEIAVQLARHFVEARNRVKAVHFLQRAGEQAAAQFANDEALKHFSQALELATEWDVDTRYALLLAREKVYHLRGERDYELSDLQALQALASSLKDPLRQAEVALRQADYESATGDFPAAVSASQAALEWARAAEDPISQAKAHLAWGNALTSQGEYEPARVHFTQALTLAQTTESHRMDAAAFRSLGNIAHYQGNHAEAEKNYQKSLDAASRSGDLWAQGAALSNLGVTYMNQGDFDKARESGERALHIKRQTGDRQGESTVFQNLGRLAQYRGNFAEAKGYLERALHIYREVDDRQGEGMTLNALGIVLSKQGDFAGATVLCEQAISIAREQGDQWQEGMVLLNLAAMYGEQGNHCRAREYAAQSLVIREEIGDLRGQSWSLSNLGIASANLGDLAQAKAYIESSLALKREIGEKHGVGDMLCHLAEITHDLQDDQAAQSYADEALAIAQEADNRPAEAAALTSLGDALTGLGNIPGAMMAYRKALSLRRELEQGWLATLPLAGMADISLAQGDLAQAQSLVEEILTTLEAHHKSSRSLNCRVYLTCYRVLRANRDPRATTVLGTAYTLLQEEAAKIEDEALRESFLENLPVRSELVAEFAKL